MKNLPEELIYVLIFGAVVLVQYLIKRFGPQQQQHPAQDEPDAELPAQAASVAVSGSARTDTLFGRSRAPEASATGVKPQSGQLTGPRLLA